MRGDRFDEDGDYTTSMGWVPYPELQASIQYDWVRAMGWPSGAEVYLTINGQDFGSAIVEEGDHTSANFDLGEYELQIGDLVTVTDGVQEKSLTVSLFEVTGIDTDTEVVSGMGTPGAQLYASVHHNGNNIWRGTTADNITGAWEVDFSGVVDIQAGSEGDAQERDDDGDATWYEWNVPIDIDRDGITDVLDPCPDDATDTCNVAGSAAGVIGVDGGVLATANGKVMLSVPPESLGYDVTLSITDMGGGYELATDEGLMMIVHSYSIQPNGTQFDPPASITFRWDDTDDDGIVDGTALQEADLVMIKDGTIITPFCSVNPNCDMNSNELTVQVSDLSLFALAVPIEWTLNGFYQPVDMNDVYNIVKGGSTVPLKFEIFAGSTELTDIAYIKSLTYAQTACDAVR